MSWLTPKTDWQSSDYFNIEDYNRIATNLQYVKGFIKRLQGKVTYFKKMGSKSSYYDYLTPAEVNNFQDNLERVNELSYNLDIGESTEYEIGGYTPDYEQWNRLESFTLELHDTLVTDNPQHTRLTQKLGNRDSSRGIRL